MPNAGVWKAAGSAGNYTGARLDHTDLTPAAPGSAVLKRPLTNAEAVFNDAINIQGGDMDLNNPNNWTTPV